MAKSVIYKAEITTTNDQAPRQHISMTADELKKDTAIILHLSVTKQTPAKLNFQSTFGS